MIFSFDLRKEYVLPIFNNSLGEKDAHKLPMQICMDTGASLTTFYQSYRNMKLLYPNIQETDKTVTINDANGNSNQYRIYKIPQFCLTDDTGNNLYIKDLLCTVAGYSIPVVDVLLSGGLFYNTIMTITPYKEDNVIGRRIKINTSKSDRDTLTMSAPNMSKYYAWLLNTE